jgi:3-hydroxybutyryl-CoA dehydrogenase
LKTICVCGAGTMGSGIAQVFAAAGFTTILFDLNTTVLDKAKEKISKKLETDLIKYTTDINDCHADLIIEAIIEKTEAKVDLFNKLLDVNQQTILATNTSSLSVTAIADKLSDPSILLGIHFFNPAPVMKLVEVISTKYISAEIIDNIISLIRSIGKTPVLCKDAPGFIVNHVARPYYLEALHVIEKGHSNYAAIDELMEATGFKMGPFKLMDLIGNDINYSVSCIVYDALEKPARLQPSSIQQQKVTAGDLGRKTGKGYYEYPAK